MAVPQRARSWLAIFAFSATLALSSSCETYSAAARNVKRTALTDVTPSLAEQPSPPPKICRYCRSGRGAFNGHRPSPFAHDRMDGK